MLADALFTPAPEREDFRESSPIHIDDEPSTTGKVVESGDSSTPISLPVLAKKSPPRGVIRSPALSEPPRPMRTLSASAILEMRPRPSTVVKLRPRRWPTVIVMVTLAAGALGWLAWNNRPAPRTTFAVDSTPKGADVYVDDTQVGTTPVRAQIGRDGRDHHVELRKVGFWPARQRARADGDAQELSAQLEPARGSFKVRSKPARAHVSVDGATACDTPCTVENLETKRKHSVRVVLDG